MSSLKQKSENERRKNEDKGAPVNAKNNSFSIKKHDLCPTKKDEELMNQLLPKLSSLRLQAQQPQRDNKTGNVAERKYHHSCERGNKSMSSLKQKSENERRKKSE
eukprot:CAMPEP_0171322242 /NCGR_PEP_ID=MMETSP0816-20121228/114838_1 /TAXON_ID=420281 /ORGANISM="Proboscia inermis, Strain CCAP1064/1" /LENGTH=104 /DNA_ID=CAMNT_0011820669 /DNA_START=376 /DNA_END=690 /DNA_ORIENTATION=-